MIFTLVHYFGRILFNTLYFFFFVDLLPEHQTEEAYHKKIDPQQVIAVMRHTDGREPTVLTYV